MKTSEQINELAEALARAQGEMKPAAKSRTNTFFNNSKYADLSDCYEACRAPLSKNSLSVLQSPSNDGDKISVTTRIMHKSGQWIEDTLSVKPQDASPQKAVATITYLRRVGLSTMVGIASDDDDDGNTANGNKAELKPREEPQIKTNPVSIKASVKHYGEYVAKVGSIKGRPISSVPMDDLKDIASKLSTWGQDKKIDLETAEDEGSELYRMIMLYLTSKDNKQ